MSPGAAAPSQLDETLAESHCIACGRRTLAESRDFRDLPRVSSDAKPFRPGGRLAQCSICGLVQKLPDPIWLGEAEEIYTNYEMFHQGDGADQKVRDPETGQLVERCQLICRQVSRSAQPDRILDLGCGTGVFLRACSERFPSSSLYGFDLDDRAATRLAALPRFKELFIGDLDRISGRFSLVALIHSLEHLPNPVEDLFKIGQLLEPGGRLLVQVPDAAASPLDLVVADHLTHFDRFTLGRLLNKAGYELVSGPSHWVGKELSAVAVFKGEDMSAQEPSAAASQTSLENQLRWLQRFGEGCRFAAGDRPFGIFGSSIAAAWLAGQVDGGVDFFLDEDENRVGKCFLGSPILAPAQRPLGSCVYIGLLPATAAAIADRLEGGRGQIVEPPPLD